MSMSGPETPTPPHHLPNVNMKGRVYCEMCHAKLIEAADDYYVVEDDSKVDKS